MISPTLTIKVVGHQWYWSYEYSDFVTDSGESIDFDSYMIPESDLELGQFRLLDVDNKLIVPVDCHIRLIVTGADVLHSFAVPSLGLKLDGVPGRLNQVSFLAERPGTFYGQCSEICGIYHGFMPIVVEAVSPPDFLLWIDSNQNSLTPLLYVAVLKSSLNAMWVTGFTDAEGSFIVSISKRSKSNKWLVRTSFELGLNNKDITTLHDLKSFFGIGKVSIRKYKNVASYSVTKNSDLINVIIPHFTNFPLQTQKRVDFEIWTKIVNLFMNKEHLSEEGFLKVLSLKSILNRGLTKATKENKNIDVMERPLHLVNYDKFKSIDPHWLSGFTAGDGSFNIKITERSKTKFQVELRFRITQHIRDSQLLVIIANYLGCGKVYIRSTNLACDLVVHTFPDNINKIIPFFNKYPLRTNKEKDFKSFVLAAECVKNKSHLTPEGLATIRKIKSNMNNNRD